MLEQIFSYIYKSLPFQVKPTEREIKNDKEDEKHDIAFELGSLKIHIHYDGDGEHHRLKPYCVDFTDLTEAVEMFPPGKYRLWCPIYSSGQGFMQTGSVANQSPLRYQVKLTGYTSIQIKDNTADTVDQQDTTGMPLFIPLYLHLRKKNYFACWKILHVYFSQLPKNVGQSLRKTP